MADIVEWLRGLSTRRKKAFGPAGAEGCRYDEAADEIDRLRAARRMFEENRLLISINTMEINRLLKAAADEIGRLREALAEAERKGYEAKIVP